MPTPSFFTAEQKLPIAQKKVSVQAENGLQYSLGQKVNFVIPASVGNFMPSETYLRMNVKISYPAGVVRPTRLQLDSALGGNVLIKDCRISSGGAQNVLLEEIQNANILTALKYDYETNDNHKSKRALTEGALKYSQDTRPTLGAEQYPGTNITSNPYYKKEGATADTEWTDADFEEVKCLIKIPGGIFGNSKIFPLSLTDGLRVELILEDANKIFQQPESVLRDRSIQSNPRWHSKDGLNASSQTGNWQVGATSKVMSTFYVTNDNNQFGGAQNFPFCVGEEISWFNVLTGVDLGAGGASPLLYDTAAIISKIESDTVDSRVLTKVTLKNPCTLLSTNANTQELNTADWALYSRSLISQSSFEPSVLIDNVELIVQEVRMPDGYNAKMNQMLKEGGSLNYDFLSFTNMKYSQLESDRVVNIRLPIQFSRCKSALCIPVDATPYSTKQSIEATTTYEVNQIEHDCGFDGDTVYAKNNSTRSGLVGVPDNVTQYQFIYDGKLNPNRKVPLARISVKNASGNQGINQQSFIENEKALYMAGIEPLSFRKFQENFFIGRAFSLQNGVYDARGKDFNLQVDYQETAGPSKPHLWNCFIAHLRRIVVRGDSISLEV